MSDPIYDVIIIGGGVSGIHAAHHIQKSFPEWKYTVIEGREALGGTWDLFRYPGIRSDSDLYTFGFPWYPWKDQTAFAQGRDLARYISAAAASCGIDRHVQFQTKIVTMNWSSDRQWWSLDALASDGAKKQHKALCGRFIVLGTGYYDYDTPFQTSIPGLGSFQGQVIHPQSWPEDLDYGNKKIVVIGSGATAVTLLPNLAEKASRVTMVQRSPTYVLARPPVDIVERWIRILFPLRITHVLLRWKNIFLQTLLYYFCIALPQTARRWLRRETIKQLPLGFRHDPHFEPSYNPWEQRLCISPDGDFYAALRTGKADIQTGIITNMTANSICLESGENIPADIIVTATGLKILLAGGIQICVDHQPIHFKDKFIWNGIMVQDVPNCVFLLGSTNLSWTLGIDTSMTLAKRVFQRAKYRGSTSVVAVIQENISLNERRLLNLNSTYLKAAGDQMPKAGDHRPWSPRSTYYRDYINAHFGSIADGLVYFKQPKR